MAIRPTQPRAAPRTRNAPRQRAQKQRTAPAVERPRPAVVAIGVIPHPLVAATALFGTTAYAVYHHSARHGREGVIGIVGSVGTITFLGLGALTGFPFLPLASLAGAAQFISFMNLMNIRLSMEGPGREILADTVQETFAHNHSWNEVMEASPTCQRVMDRIKTACAKEPSLHAWLLGPMNSLADVMKDVKVLYSDRRLQRVMRNVCDYDPFTRTLIMGNAWPDELLYGIYKVLVSHRLAQLIASDDTPEIQRQFLASVDKGEITSRERVAIQSRAPEDNVPLAYTLAHYAYPERLRAGFANLLRATEGKGLGARVFQGLRRVRTLLAHGLITPQLALSRAFIRQATFGYFRAHHVTENSLVYGLRGMWDPRLQQTVADHSVRYLVGLED